MAGGFAVEDPDSGVVSPGPRAVPRPTVRTHLAWDSQ
jgi:hypothetical protein